jgi:hypothetical protein
MQRVGESSDETVLFQTTLLENAVIRTTDNHQQSESIREQLEPTKLRLIQDAYHQVQKLVSLHVQLTRREIEKDLRQRAVAAIFLAVGAGCGFLASLMLSFTFVHGLQWLALPNEAWTSEFPASRLPLWACYAIAALALTLLGATLIAIGRRKFRTIVSFQHMSSESFKAHKL